jgi:arabinan endo-1,5-alpha-L-arabinosidase
MLVWELCGQVFEKNPDWVVEAIVGVKDLWAPDIIFYNDQFYLFYSASTFGSNRSAIGLATNTTLDPQSPAYTWVDQGEVISSQKTDRYNAIDPNLTFDKEGQPWLVFGSFWSGIKMIKVDPSTLKPAAGEELISLAAKPGTDAVEGAFITRRGDYYYLFVSHDFCCKGVMSTYNIRVGRSAEIQGPYLDQEGKPLTEGGGTLVYKGSERWRGPGHNSIFIKGEIYSMVYHAYDAQAGGIPTLRIEELMWDEAGWPQSPSALLGQ